MFGIEGAIFGIISGERNAAKAKADAKTDRRKQWHEFNANGAIEGEYTVVEIPELPETKRLTHE